MLLQRYNANESALREKRQPEIRLRSQAIIVAENNSFSFTNTRLEKAYSGYIKGCNSPRRWIFYVR